MILLSSDDSTILNIMLLLSSEDEIEDCWVNDINKLLVKFTQQLGN